MKLYPLMLSVEDRNAVVIGGGSVAARKVSDLVERGARVTVIAPDVDPAIIELQVQHSGRIEIVHREYAPGDLKGAFIVFSATDDESVTERVFNESGELNVLLNAVDDPDHCGFFVPSWFSRGGLVVAVSTSGISPALAARIRREIEGIIPGDIEETLSALHRARTVLKNDPAFMELDPENRGKILKHIVFDDEQLRMLVRSCRDDSLILFLRKIAEGVA